MNDGFNIFENFSIAIDIGIKIIDKEGAQLYISEIYKKNSIILQDLNEIYHFNDEGNICFVYGGQMAYKYGSPYIFFCPRGLVHYAVPLIQNGEHFASVIAGPILMTDYDEYIEIDVCKKALPDSFYRDKLKTIIKEIPFATPEKVRAISEQLHINVLYYNQENKELLNDTKESQNFQSYISEYVSQIKSEQQIIFYPLDKEDALLKAISLGDKALAKALLNDILGHLFFTTGADFSIFRSRIIELIVLLSRAAVKGGAETELIFGLNYIYLKEIESFTTIEELTFWLNKILYRFTDYVFNFVYVKHVDIIYKSINYMKHNYMNKLTLDDVAKNVYLSAAYLSKIFKEETKQNFNNYLNIIRIEESKKLLKDKSINLTEIAGLVGYEDQSYFSKVFKKMEGISPGKYRATLETLK